jgi:DNA-binding response OmpR family regulator
MSITPKILIIGDEYESLMLLNYHLQHAGHQVLLAWNGSQAMEYVRHDYPRLVIIDRPMQEPGNLELCSRLRDADDSMAIAILSGQSSEDLRVKSFEAGADDFIVKPFNSRELILRVSALLRRVAVVTPIRVHLPQREYAALTATLPEGDLFSEQGFQIDVDRRQVYKNGRELELTRLEFDLLKFLYDHRGYVLSRDKLLVSVWKYNSSGDERVVDVVMARLRKKLEDDPNSPNYIQTIRGVGYKYVA